MPVHNEQDNLLYSLPRIFALNPDEVVVILDRCEDRSRDVIEGVANRVGYVGNLNLIEVSGDFPDWRYRVACLFRMGFEAARNDIILTMAADIVPDVRIRDFVPMIESSDMKLMSFGLKYYPVSIVYFVKRLVTLAFPMRGFSGVFLFSKKAWRETEDVERVKRIVKAQDTFLARSIATKYRTGHAWLNVVHLRVRRDAKDQYMRGVTAYQIMHKSLPAVFASSIIYLSPMMLKGYIYAAENRRRKLSA